MRGMAFGPFFFVQYNPSSSNLTPLGEFVALTKEFWYLFNFRHPSQESFFLISQILLFIVTVLATIALSVSKQGLLDVSVVPFNLKGL